MRLGLEMVRTVIPVLENRITIVRKVAGITKAEMMVAVLVGSATLSISRAPHLNEVALRLIRLKLAG